MTSENSVGRGFPLNGGCLLPFRVPPAGVHGPSQPWHVLACREDPSLPPPSALPQRVWGLQVTLRMDGQTEGPRLGLGSEWGLSCGWAAWTSALGSAPQLWCFGAISEQSQVCQPLCGPSGAGAVESALGTGQSPLWRHVTKTSSPVTVEGGRSQGPEPALSSESSSGAGTAPSVPS